MMNNKIKMQTSRQCIKDLLHFSQVWLTNSGIAVFQQQKIQKQMLLILNKDKTNMHHNLYYQYEKFYSI